MNTRKQKGLQIAALNNLTRKGTCWLVPSQTNSGIAHPREAKARVKRTPRNPQCPKAAVLALSASVFLCVLSASAVRGPCFVLTSTPLCLGG